MLTIKEPYWFKRNDDYAESIVVQSVIDSTFANHEANVLLDDENFFIVDWRNKNEPYVYAIRYVLDKKEGVFTAYGHSCVALDTSVAYWDGSIKPDEIAVYISDIARYIRHIVAGDIKGADDMLAIKELAISRDERRETMLEEEYKPEDIQEMEDDFNRMIDMITNGCSLYDGDFQDLFYKYRIGSNPIDLNKYVRHWVFIWAAGYILACEQLGMIRVIRDSGGTEKEVW